MTRYVWQDGGWIEPAKAARPRGTVAIHSDFAEPLLSHADGQMHSSRSTYDASVRAAGLEIVGRSDMKRMASGPAVRATPREPVRATLMRHLDRLND